MSAKTKRGKLNNTFKKYFPTYYSLFAKNHQPGVVMMISFVFLLVVMVLSVTFLTKTRTFLNFTARSIDTDSAVSIAQAGVEYALYQFELDNSWDGTNPGSNVQVGQGEFKVEFDSADSEVVVTSFVPSESDPNATTSKVRLEASIGPTTSPLKSAAHVDGGGILLGSNNAHDGVINGDAHTNGAITGTGDTSTINGQVTARGCISLTPPTVLNDPDGAEDCNSIPRPAYQPLPLKDPVWFTNYKQQFYLNQPCPTPPPGGLWSAGCGNNDNPPAAQIEKATADCADGTYTRDGGVGILEVHWGSSNNRWMHIPCNVFLDHVRIYLHGPTLIEGTLTVGDTGVDDTFLIRVHADSRWYAWETSQAILVTGKILFQSTTSAFEKLDDPNIPGSRYIFLVTEHNTATQGGDGIRITGNQVGANPGGLFITPWGTMRMATGASEVTLVALIANRLIVEDGQIQYDIGSADTPWQVPQQGGGKLDVKKGTFKFLQ